MQWAWATYLFTSPYYAQQACNPYTTVVLFGIPMTAYKVNHHYFGLWASWLLFSIMVTLIFGVLLVISSTSGANSNKIQRRQLRLPKTSWLADQITNWDPKGDKRRLLNFVTAFVICSLLVIFSEMQVNRNCVFGENSQWGFGQVSASPAQHSNLLNCQHLYSLLPCFLHLHQCGVLSNLSEGYIWPASCQACSDARIKVRLDDVQETLGS